MQLAGTLLLWLCYDYNQVFPRVGIAMASARIAEVSSISLVLWKPPRVVSGRGGPFPSLHFVE